MEVPGHQLLAGAGLPLDQDRVGRGGDARDRLAQNRHLRAAPEQRTVRAQGLDFVLAPQAFAHVRLADRRCDPRQRDQPVEVVRRARPPDDQRAGRAVAAADRDRGPVVAAARRQRSDRAAADDVPDRLVDLTLDVAGRRQERGRTAEPIDRNRLRVEPAPQRAADPLQGPLVGRRLARAEQRHQIAGELLQRSARTAVRRRRRRARRRGRPPQQRLRLEVVLALRARQIDAGGASVAGADRVGRLEQELRLAHHRPGPFALSAFAQQTPQRRRGPGGARVSAAGVRARRARRAASAPRRRNGRAGPPPTRRRCGRGRALPARRRPAPERAESSRPRAAKCKNPARPRFSVRERRRRDAGPVNGPRGSEISPRRRRRGRASFSTARNRPGGAVSSTRRAAPHGAGRRSPGVRSAPPAAP